MALGDLRRKPACPFDKLRVPSEVEGQAILNFERHLAEGGAHLLHVDLGPVRQVDFHGLANNVFAPVMLHAFAIRPSLTS